jgi:hypothetical protein
LSVAHPDTWVADSNGNIHTDSHCNGYVYANSNSHCYGYVYANGNGDCDRTAAAYTDAQAATHAASTPISFSA